VSDGSNPQPLEPQSRATAALGCRVGGSRHLGAGRQDDGGRWGVRGDIAPKTASPSGRRLSAEPTHGERLGPSICSRVSVQVTPWSTASSSGAVP
jgi:hypothetical protein